MRIRKVQALGLGILAALAVAQGANAAVTTGEAGGAIVAYEDGSAILAAWGTETIERGAGDSAGDGTFLMRLNADGSAQGDRVDIASTVNRYAQ